MKRHIVAGVALSFALAMSGMARADITIAIAGPITGSLRPSAPSSRPAPSRRRPTSTPPAASSARSSSSTSATTHATRNRPSRSPNSSPPRASPFVVGHFCSGSSIPASAVYADANIVQISPASTNPALTDERPGPGVFRVCGRDDQQGAVAGKFLADHFKDKNIAIIDDKSTYGKGLADETRKNMNAAGVKEVIDESYNAGEKDYTALVSKLKADNVDVLYVGGYHPEAGLIKRQMVDQGMDTILVSGDALVTDEYWQITGDAGNGTLMTFSPDPRKNPANEADRRQDVPRPRRRAGRLRALHLRRAAGLGAGRQRGRLDRLRQGRRGAELGHLQDGPRRLHVRREGRRHPAGLRRSTSGRTASTTTTSRCSHPGFGRLEGNERPRRQRRGFSFLAGCGTRRPPRNLAARP